MPYLWAGGMISEYDFSDYRGSSFRAKKDFAITELLLKTSQPDKWGPVQLWEIDPMTDKLTKQVQGGNTLSRNGEAYIYFRTPVQLVANKYYLIVFGKKSEYKTAACVYGTSGVPVQHELFETVDRSSWSSYGDVSVDIGNSAFNNGYEIQVGFTIAKPKQETYFEMCPSPSDPWSSGVHTVANQITLQQDVKVTAIEFLTHPNAASVSPGTAKIWDANNALIAKGNPSPTSVKGQWTRSAFTSSVILEKGRTYYVGCSALGIGSKANGGARNINSSDGSLLMTIGNDNWATASAVDVDTRPEKKYNWEFSIRLYVEIDNTSFLIDSDGTIKKLSGSWTDVGSAPVTDQMFKDHGMKSLNDITAEQWKALPKNSKILAYTEEDKAFKAAISRSMLYNSEDKLYRGTGIIETVAEEISAYRRTLMITAEHRECTFQYSLDNGTTWTDFQSGDVIDVSKKTGKQLKIRITLPTDSATLTAISYAWA